MNNIDNPKMIDQKFFIKLITDDLLKFDFESALSNIKNYLKKLNKREYEFLFVDLIKISFMEKDIAYAKIQLELDNISQDNYQFNLANYILTFYNEMAKNNLSVAKLYLDIITQMAKLGNEFIFIAEMTKLLEMAEQNRDNKDDLSLDILVMSKAKRSEDVPQDSTSLNSKSWASEFLYAKYQILKPQGIVLLNPMSREKEEVILKEVLNYDDVIAFVIGEGDKRQIVLRYYLAKQIVNYKRLIELGNQAFNEGNYDECICKYLELLSCGKPSSITYSRLGLAYLKKNNRFLAIDYLTVANELSKQEGLNYDYTKKIANLKKSVNNYVRKRNLSKRKK